MDRRSGQGPLSGTRSAPAALKRRWRRTILALLGFGLAATPFAASAADPGCAASRGVMSGDLAPVALAGHVTRNEPARILAIGSSSTEGVGASTPDMTYPSRLEDDLRAAWPQAPIAVANAGIGGETAEQTLLRLEKLLDAPQKPDLILWQVGTNDAVRDTGETGFRALVARGIAIAHERGAALMLIDQQYYPDVRDSARYERYVALVAEAAAEAEVPVFSRYALMRDWSGKEPGLLASMLAADGFHMSDRGYGCLAAALGGAIVDSVTRHAVGVARGKKLVPSPTQTSRKG